jgi:hypothetical protein
MPIAVLTMNATASASVSLTVLDCGRIVAALVKYFMGELMDENRGAVGRCQRLEDGDAA